ncbi:MSMEG_4193 family putative phosphomutase [Herbidospora mongoliensis]|uniref:MSMEG_4193 family putative phosphomutase n=1 Tax=Herbidospora mongoliensis TaxID=688067 RepID=UPI00082DFE9A|nr:MSMEG_4193 family putative phosphomutase [Herbidospora mongoliensis]
MTTLLLLRHGLTPLTGPVLAGRAPGVHLDERGRKQAADAAERLAGVTLDAVVSSPLERCRETVEPFNAENLEIDDRFAECDYGDWTGRKLGDLAKEPEWRVVQSHPSAAVFPGGESLAAVSARAVAAVRDWNVRLGERATYLVCSHGDVIKAIVADALGLHLDQFQRINVDPGSVTVIEYTPMRPFLRRLNDTRNFGLPEPPPEHQDGGENITGSDAAVGGGAGTT